MRVMLPGKTEWERTPSLIRAFGLDQKVAPVVSVVGAGGKTSIIEYLAGEYQALNRKVIVTTTTKMYQPEHWTWCRDLNMEAVDNFLQSQEVLWIGLPGKDTKMISPGQTFLKQLLDKGLPMLIEADGARRLPFKLPGEKEPVILENTQLVIAVLGMTAWNKPWKEVCFRYELAAEYLQKKEDKLITEEDYADVILSSHGLRKGISDRMDFMVVLNQADNDELVNGALNIREILYSRGLKRVYLTSFH